MGRLNNAHNMVMKLRQVCQHPYLQEPELEDLSRPPEESHKLLTDGSGKLLFLKQLLPRLKAKGHRVLLFSQFKMALDRIENFLWGEGYKYARLDGDVTQAKRQKDMDKFNAPDSDVFIFLLTTRAGGVGINLASADTVILFDPDFNPQMDLQAISRSHRYGQTKPVLVFKLMTENSVEERIMQMGKRKLLLDHLVVQKMNDEKEEGEVDSLILFGAEEISKLSEEDNAHYWSQKEIDGLIEGAETEAEAQAKELAAKEAVKEKDGDADAPDDAAGGEKKSGFAFARVWEIKSGGLKDVDDVQVTDEIEFDDNSWAAFLAKAAEEEAALAAKEGLTEGRRRAAKKVINYDMREINYNEDGTPVEKGRGRPRRNKSQSASDAEFDPALEPAVEEDEVYDTVPEHISDLSNDESRLLGGNLMGRRKLTKHERYLLHQARMAKLADPSGAPVTPILGEAGPGPSTQSHQQASRSGHTMPVPALEAGAGASHTPSTGSQIPSGNGTVALPQPSSASQGSSHHSPTRRTNAMKGMHVSAARDVLRNLRTFLPDPMISDWNRVCSVDKDPAGRKIIYGKLALHADAKLMEQGRAPFFTRRGSVEVVDYYIMLGKGVVTVPAGPTSPVSAALDQASHIQQPAAAQPTAVSQQLQVVPQAAPQQPLLSHHPLRAPQQPTVKQFVGGHQGPPRPNVPPAHQYPVVQPPEHRYTVHPQPVQHQQLGYYPPGYQYPINHQQPAHPQFAAPQGYARPPVGQPSYYPHQHHHPQYPQHPQQQQPRVNYNPPQRVEHQQQQQPRPPIPPVAYPMGRPPSSGANGTTRHPVANGTPAVTQAAPRPPAAVNTSVTARPAASVAAATPSPRERLVIPLSSDKRRSLGARMTSTNVMQLGDSSRFSAGIPTVKSSELFSKPCYWCQEDHALVECPKLTPLDELKSIQVDIMASVADEEETEKGLMALELMQAAHAVREQEAKKIKKRRLSKKSANGTAGDPIVLGSDTEPPSRADTNAAPPQKRQKNHNDKSPSPENSANKSADKSADKRAEKSADKSADKSNDTTAADKIEKTGGCVVCGSSTFHPSLSHCPVVLAGTESIAAAMERFKYDETYWQPLSTIYKSKLSAPSSVSKCAYCGQACGKTVRQCAESQGTRKDLKRKIRELEIPLNVLDDKLKQLMAAFKTTGTDGSSSDQGRRQSTIGEIMRVEGELKKVHEAVDPLYNAYLEWPNPRLG